MKKRIIKQVGIVILLVLVSIGTYKGVDLFLTLNAEKSRDFVYLDQKKKADEVIFFYRDDCSYCRKVYPYLAQKKALFGNKITFVNLKNKKNRQYISEYNLTQVPALVRKNSTRTEMYIGTSTDKIDQFLKEE